MRSLRQNLKCGTGPELLTSEVLTQLDELYDYGVQTPYSVLIALECDSRGPMPAVRDSSLALLDRLISRAQAFRAMIQETTPRELQEWKNFLNPPSGK